METLQIDRKNKICKKDMIKEVDNVQKCWIQIVNYQTFSTLRMKKESRRKNNPLGFKIMFGVIF
jgi:type IV secretory pathway component VirB8